MRFARSLGSKTEEGTTGAVASSDGLVKVVLEGNTFSVSSMATLNSANIRDATCCEEKGGAQEQSVSRVGVPCDLAQQRA